MRFMGWITRWTNLHFCLFPIRSWTRICFQYGQSNRFVCFQCAREARSLVSGCRWQWLGLGLSSAVARAWVSTSGGSVPCSLLWVGLWFFFFFFFNLEAWVCESVEILVLIWYWFVNFLSVNLFCNFVIKKCHIIKKKMSSHWSIIHVSNTSIDN